MMEPDIIDDVRFIVFFSLFLRLMSSTYFLEIDGLDRKICCFTIFFFAKPSAFAIHIHEQIAENVF